MRTIQKVHNGNYAKCEEVVVLKRDVEFKQYEINKLKAEFEKLKQAKDAIDFKIEKFDKASKDLDRLLGSQITDKSKKGFGYCAVPPHPLIYNRPNKLDLSYFGLDEFKEPEFISYGPENSKKESNIIKESDNSKENSDKYLVKDLESQVSEEKPKKVRENNDAPIIEDWVSDDEEQDESITKPEKKTITPTTAKIEKPVRKSVRGLDTVEAQLVTYRKNEVLFSEEVVVLNRDVEFKQYEINKLKAEFERLKQAKDAIDFKIKKFDKASKDLDQLLGTLTKLDLSYSGLDEFKEPEFKGYGPESSKKESNIVKESDNSKENYNKSLVKELESQVKSSFVKGCECYTNKKVRENNDAPIIKDWVSEDKEQDVSITKPEKKTVTPTAAKIEKPVRKSVRYADMYRSQRTRGNQRNWNGQKSNQLGKPQHDDKGFIDSGCLRHMTGNIAYLSNFKQFDRGYVAFGGGAYGGRITGKGTLKTDNLDFEDVYFVNELKFNLFSVSQMCDKKNYVLFTDTKCLVLSLNFKLPDENQILFKIPRNDNMYSFDMKNIVPKESLTYFVAKATLDESMLWHRRLGHINFKNINKLVKDNLVRGLPTKRFENDQTCIPCLKGKQHRASCKSKILNPITKPLFMQHMDLFGPTLVSSLMHKKYCLVVTDDYSRFTWVFFLTLKDETSEILKSFIKEIENLVDKKVKIIRSDNGTEFKNKVMDDFCREKGIKREYSVARTPQQNGVAERRNRTLIEAARTMLADSKLPTTFWAEAVSTACYVQNRVLVVKPHNKTPYELFRGFKPALSFMRPFGCHVTILNTLDSLGKFDGKSDEGFFVG
ncbi:putative ribonuclease H-like domain-containing protein [Tanacetum coccineum]